MEKMLNWAGDEGPTGLSSAWLHPRGAASVSPGKITVAPRTTCGLNFRMARDATEAEGWSGLRPSWSGGIAGDPTAPRAPGYSIYGAHPIGLAFSAFSSIIQSLLLLLLLIDPQVKLPEGAL